MEYDFFLSKIGNVTLKIEQLVLYLIHTSFPGQLQADPAFWNLEFNAFSRLSM
jgi:hypothetical protein